MINDKAALEKCAKQPKYETWHIELLLKHFRTKTKPICCTGMIWFNWTHYLKIENILQEAVLIWFQAQFAHLVYSLCCVIFP